jgi:hypothetical protein
MNNAIPYGGFFHFSQIAAGILQCRSINATSKLFTNSDIFPAMNRETSHEDSF